MLPLVIGYQKIHEQPDPRRHRRAAHEHGMDRLQIARIETFQEWHQTPAGQILGD